MRLLKVKATGLVKPRLCLLIATDDFSYFACVITEIASIYRPADGIFVQVEQLSSIPNRIFIFANHILGPRPFH